jgi:hypothetical protein
MLAVPNADGVAFAGAPGIANIDVVVASGDFEAGTSPQSNVICPGGIVKERTATDGNVAVPGSVA